MQTNSRKLFEEAQEYIPGGVNSPVRAGKAVGIDPPFILRAEGCHIWDVDGNQYIDHVCSWGPVILGHAYPSVIEAIAKSAAAGATYGAPTKAELEIAKMIVEMVPSIEMVRMVNSGTEATMSAIRLARGFTGRDKIIKFDGCYHGHADSLLVSAGSGIATLGIPDSPGIPEDIARQTISLPFNDLEAIHQTFRKFGKDIAAIIVEPVPGNMGVIIPEQEFLKGLREITLQHDSLLIFDEVITGFRIAGGGAQELFGIKPDITCLGKIIGGGLPVGAYGGSKKIMLNIAPAGDIYQAGTLSGNPLAMAAGIATLKVLKQKGTYELLEKKGAALFSGLKKAAAGAGIPVTINRVGSMGSVFFTAAPVIDFASALVSNKEQFKQYFLSMLKQGVYLAPSPFEAGFVSLAHDDQTIQKTITAAATAFASL
jgi:glutamate-1-semialdehyde 2,1-aminomutase